MENKETIQTFGLEALAFAKDPREVNLRVTQKHFGNYSTLRQCHENREVNLWVPKNLLSLEFTPLGLWRKALQLLSRIDGWLCQITLARSEDLPKCAKPTYGLSWMNTKSWYGTMDAKTLPMWKYPTWTWTTLIYTPGLALGSDVWKGNKVHIPEHEDIGYRLKSKKWTPKPLE